MVKDPTRAAFTTRSSSFVRSLSSIPRMVASYEKLWCSGTPREPT